MGEKMKIPSEVAGIVDYVRQNAHNIKGKMSSMGVCRYDVTVCCNSGRVLRSLVSQVKGSAATSGGSHRSAAEEIVYYCQTDATFHAMVEQFHSLKIDIVFRMSGSALVGAPLIQEKL